MKSKYALLLLLLTLPSLGSEIDPDRKGTRWAGWPFLNFSSDEGWNWGALARVFFYGQEGRKPFEALATATVDISSRGRKWVAGSYEKTHFLNDPKLRVQGDVSVLSNRFSRYYGLGENSILDREQDRSGYYFHQTETFSFRPGLRYNLIPGLDLGFGIAFQFDRLQPSTPSSQYEQDFGASPNETYSTRFQIGAILERRDSEFVPSQGYYAASGITTGPSFLGQRENSWLRFDAEFRKYFEVLENRWLWIATQARYSGATSDTPLTDQPRLGSFGTLRGLPLNRYISNHSASFRAELRSFFVRFRLFDLPAKGGLGLFTDMGRVGGNFGSLFSGRNHVAYGISIMGSYFTDDFIGRTDIGFSEGNTAVYIGLGHSF